LLARESRADIDRLAADLVDRRFMTGDELMALLKHDDADYQRA
jgi:hypothetical protein